MTRVKLLGVLQLARPIPLAVWTLGCVLLGVSAAPGLQPGWPLPVAAVLIGGVLLQGYITHGLNDFYDWHSGTDRDNPAWLSGGSHAVQSGRLAPTDLWVIAVAAIGLYLVLLVALAAQRGWLFLAFGLPALVASVAYSLPPLRLGYRPLLGEWLGMFPTITAGVLAAGYAAGGRLTPEIWGVALLNGIMCNASVMEHHLADVELDWQATPQKRTSPAFWQKAVGRPGSEVAVAYSLLVALVAVGFAWLSSPRFLFTAVLGLCAAYAAQGTRIGDAADQTRRDGALKTIAFLNAAGFAFLALAGLP